MGYNKNEVINDLSQRSSEHGRRGSFADFQRSTMTLKEVDNKDYIKEKMDYIIGAIVQDNMDIKKCYSYYNSERNLDDFAYLTDSYGLGNPEELTFTPLIAERVDILVGILLAQSLDYDANIADGESYMMKEKEKATHLVDNLIAEIMGDQAKIDAIVSPEKMKEQYGDEVVDFTGKGLIKKMMNQIRSDYTDNFQAASQALIGYAINSHTVGFKDKRKELFKNLIISGMGVFRNMPTKVGVHPEQRVLDSRGGYLQVKNNETNIAKYDSAVYKERMTKGDIIVEYGKYMTKQDIIDLLNFGSDISSSRIVNSGYDMNRFSSSDDFYSTYGEQLNSSEDVYYVEYKEEALIPKKKVGFSEKLGDILKGELDYKNNKGHVIKQFLYKGIRVGDMYINIGRDVTAKRSLDNPNKVELSFGGINLNKYNSFYASQVVDHKRSMFKPHSIVFNMLDLQDMYDVILFHSRNLIANSSVPGQYVNMAAVPKEFGNTFEERLLKYTQYMKQGFAVINPTQKGADLFNNYGSFAGGVDANGIQANQIVLKMLEYQADMISGVNAPMRGQIEQKDAVHNVKVGIQQVSYVTKEYYHYIDIISERYLMGFLDLIKESFPAGLAFSYNEGLQKVSFKALGKYYRATNYVVSIQSISENMETLMKLQAAAQEMGAGGLIDPLLALEIQADKSIQGILNRLKRSIKDTQKKNNVIEQMNQKLEETTGQAEQLKGEYDKTVSDLDKLKKELMSFGQENQLLKVENAKVKSDVSIKREELENRKEVDERKADAIDERTKLEREQLYMAEGSAKEIKNLN